MIARVKDEKIILDKIIVEIQMTLDIFSIKFSLSRKYTGL